MSSEIKAKVLVDNISYGCTAGEWGLCIYIEFNGRRILLDTGKSSLFLTNARRCGADIAGVDFAVLSHAHFDHAGGMKDFFFANKKAKFYLSAGAGENCYKKVFIFPKYVGIGKGTLAEYSGRIEYVQGKYALCEGVWLLPHTTPGLEAAGLRENMYQRRGRRYYPDDFSHEQSLVIDTGEGLVIFNSCSHAGASTIINEVKEAFPGREVLGMVGGFHLFNKSSEEIHAFARKLRETGVRQIWTGHCSGQKAFEILRAELGDSMHQMRAGADIVF